VEDILAIVFIFGGGSVFLLAISPIGRAIADRIRGVGVGAGASEETVRRLHDTQQAILDDLEGVRQELGEIQERLDFTERLLARQREVGQLPLGEAQTRPPERGL
jgi:Tfp pilus assembly protein PilO